MAEPIIRQSVLVATMGNLYFLTSHILVKFCMGLPQQRRQIHVVSEKNAVFNVNASITFGRTFPEICPRWSFLARGVLWRATGPTQMTGCPLAQRDVCIMSVIYTQLICFFSTTILTEICYRAAYVSLKCFLYNPKMEMLEPSLMIASHQTFCCHYSCLSWKTELSTEGFTFPEG